MQIRKTAEQLRDQQAEVFLRKRRDPFTRKDITDFMIDRIGPLGGNWGHYSTISNIICNALKSGKIERVRHGLYKVTMEKPVIVRRRSK